MKGDFCGDVKHVGGCGNLPWPLFSKERELIFPREWRERDITD
jgi:hypothetical protein